MPLSHTRKRPRTRPYLPRKSKGVESGATESEAVRLLAARIPQELFDDILFYVNVDRASQRKYESGNYLKRNRGVPNPEDILTDLKRCSLVCLFWANRCRKHMFWDRTLLIVSYEDAEIFRQYVVGGCPRLTPMHQLIRRIEVIQNYSEILAPQHCERHTSFLHLLYLPAIHWQDKLKSFSIQGPVPHDFNHAKLDTPHWGIPPFTIAVPNSFLQNTKIYLEDVHLPSFYHVTKYIKHFSRATQIEFVRVTWDRQMAPSLPHVPSTIACQRRPRSLEIEARGDCTDSVHLALTALMLNPNCPVHRLSDEKRVWMINLMMSLWGYEKDLRVFVEFNVSEQTTTMRLDLFHFVFEETLSTDPSASALSVVGMHAYIHGISWTKPLPAIFDALVNHTRTQPTIRALVLLFGSLEGLQKSLTRFVEVLTPATESIELVLAYEKEEERKAVGVDLIMLEPDGRIWVDLPNWGGDNSLQMLQRELKKKK